MLRAGAYLIQLAEGEGARAVSVELIEDAIDGLLARMHAEREQSMTELIARDIAIAVLIPDHKQILDAHAIVDERIADLLGNALARILEEVLAEKTLGVFYRAAPIAAR